LTSHNGFSEMIIVRLVNWLKAKRVPLLIFCFALFVRLVVFSLISVDWKSVSYHLWQIGYFTLHLGLKHGRMWDLHGCEYLYPILPSLTQAFLMGLFRTASNIPFRVLNMVLSSLTASFIYLVGKERFSKKIGLFAAFFVSIFPGFVIWNILNLYETMAAFFFVAALYVWDKNLFYSGILLGLAAQSRIEFWPITFGVCLSILFYEKENKVDKLIPVVSGWLLVMVPFSYVYLTHTGNFIYPLYYGLFGGFGFTVTNPTPGGLSLSGQLWRLFWIFIVLCSAAILLYMVKKKPKNYFVYVFSLGVVTFHGIQWSMGGVSIFNVFFYRDGIFNLFPLTSKYFIVDLALGSLIIAGFLYRKLTRLYINIILVALIALAAVSMVPVIQKVQVRQPDISGAHEIVEATLRYYNGGTIVCDSVLLNYVFCNEPWNIHAENIIGSFYTPLYYGDYNMTALESWFRANNITIWLNTGLKSSGIVFNFIQKEKPSFLVLLTVSNGLESYRVNYD